MNETEPISNSMLTAKYALLEQRRGVIHKVRNVQGAGHSRLGKRYGALQGVGMYWLIVMFVIFFNVLLVADIRLIALSAVPVLRCISNGNGTRILPCISEVCKVSKLGKK